MDAQNIQGEPLRPDRFGCRLPGRAVSTCQEEEPAGRHPVQEGVAFAVSAAHLHVRHPSACRSAQEL